MHRLANILVSITALWLTALPAFALTVDKPLPDAVLEARAIALFSEIRCMVCQSETIADSHAQVAGDMRRNVRESITAGLSDGQIKAELATRYGDVILMKPPLKYSTLLLWFGPWILLMIGMLSIYFYFRPARTLKKP
jgi:cytochrome c-type biogenesis protein CcmH